MHWILEMQYFLYLKVVGGNATLNPHQSHNWMLTCVHRKINTNSPLVEPTQTILTHATLSAKVSSAILPTVSLPAAKYNNITLSNSRQEDRKHDYGVSGVFLGRIMRIFCSTNCLFAFFSFIFALKLNFKSHSRMIGPSVSTLIHFL